MFSGNESGLSAVTSGQWLKGSLRDPSHSPQRRFKGRRVRHGDTFRHFTNLLNLLKFHENQVEIAMGSDKCRKGHFWPLREGTFGRLNVELGTKFRVNGFDGFVQKVSKSGHFDDFTGPT